MHNVKRAQNRYDGKPKKVGKQKDDGAGAVQRGKGWCEWMGEKMGEGWHSLAGWLLSTRSVSACCFVFGLLGRTFHVFDPLLQDYKSNFPSYLYCPAMTFVGTVAFILGTRLQNATSLPQVMTMVCCCGVLAGAIIEEQLEIVMHNSVTDKDYMYMGVACIVLSFCVYMLDYGWGLSMKGVLKRAIIIATPAWYIVLYQLFPLPALPIQLGLFLSFTLAVGIVEHYVTDVRSRVPIFSSVFPAPYIGCMVQSFAMVALSTYVTSLRLSLFSDSWFSFAWMVFAGPPLGVFTLVCHLIYWTSEKIFGPGPHNTTYVVRAAIFAWGAAFVAHQLGFYQSVPKWKVW